MSITKWRIKINRTKSVWEVYPPQTEVSLPIKFADQMDAIDYVDCKIQTQLENLKKTIKEAIPQDKTWGKAYAQIGPPLEEALALMLLCPTDGPDPQEDEYPEFPELTNYNTL